MHVKIPNAFYAFLAGLYPFHPLRIMTPGVAGRPESAQ